MRSFEELIPGSGEVSLPGVGVFGARLLGGRHEYIGGLSVTIYRTAAHTSNDVCHRFRSVRPSGRVHKLPKNIGITAVALLFWITDGVREDRKVYRSEQDELHIQRRDVTRQGHRFLTTALGGS